MVTSPFKEIAGVLLSMPYATNDGVRLAYERAGPSDAETVVFVEGLGYGRWMWRWQHRAVSDDYESIRWDNRGTGASDEPEGPYTIPEMASDLEAVLDDANVDAAHVVGASMGGMIAQQYALDYDRATSLTLMCTSPGGPEEVPIPEDTLDRMYGVPEDADERETIRYKMRPALTDGFWDDNPDLIERIVDWRLESDASEQARVWQGQAVDGFDVHDRLDEITLPTLLLHGTADRVVPYENGELLAEGLPDVDFVTLEGAPHLLFIERRRQVDDHLLEFLDDV
jgi:pimeloyl-ACP methyl ester carboxylesterase